jgi:phosphoribosylglycinamide formyltransferase-1
MGKLALGIVGSHTGTNMQAIVDACSAGRLDAQVAVVVSNNGKSGVAERAARHGLPFVHISSVTHPDPDLGDRALADALSERGAELVVLAGYMKKLGPATLERFRRRIINTHPALLPKYGGHGMYGDHVHRAVLDAGETETGVSVHFVDGDYDTGPVIAQARVPVLPGDTVETLSERVKARERNLLVETIAQLIAERTLTGS